MLPQRKDAGDRQGQQNIGTLLSGRETKLRICRQKGALPKLEGENPEESSALACADKTFKFKPLPALAPRYDGFDAHPHYFIVGGLVWTEMSIPLFLEKAKAKAEWPTTTLNMAVHNWKMDDNHKLVVLLDVLTDDVNTYLNLQTLGILWHVNNRPVRGIREMIRIIGDLIKEG